MKTKKKKLKGRKRRAFDLEAFNQVKFRQEVMWKEAKLRQAFPDRQKRKEYIAALINGLETEPILEQWPDI
jgi:hypothetical protein